MLRLAAALLLLAGTAHAQLANFPPGSFANKAAHDGVSVAACSFVGVGDKTSGTVVAHYGPYAYSSTTCGAPVYRVCDPAGANCTDFVTSSTTGQLVWQTVNGTVCLTAGTCKITTFYDTSPDGDHCVQTTAANMPTLSNATGAPLAIFSGSQWCATVLSGAVIQPHTYIGIFTRTAGYSAFQVMLSSASGATGSTLAYQPTDNFFYINAGTTLARDTGNHGGNLLSGVVNGGSSQVCVFNFCTVSGAAGAQAGNKSFGMGALLDTTFPLTGQIGEVVFLAYLPGGTEMHDLCVVLSVNVGAGAGACS